MRTRQVWLVLDVVGFSKTPSEVKSCISQSVEQNVRFRWMIQHQELKAAVCVNILSVDNNNNNITKTKGVCTQWHQFTLMAPLGVPL